MEKQHGITATRIIILIACLLAIHSLIILSENPRDQMLHFINFTKSKFGIASGSGSSRLDDSLLGSLSTSGYNQESCISRSRFSFYRKISPKRPSKYLISKIREYEDRHKKCGPYTEAYNRTVQLINSGNISSTTECSYIVWVPEAGLGNRILTISSAFLYAILTRKVLLVRFLSDMSDVFCEPFPDTSWLLPPEFPLEVGFNKSNPNTFGSLLRNKSIDLFNMSSTPNFMYIYLAAGLTYQDKLFYCEDYHGFFRRITWLILRSDEYFVPSLFLMSSFRDELDVMFPDKESVFHHLGRYLFHPSNKAWGLITRFRNSYLSKANEQVGLQIRVVNPNRISFPTLMDQILACTNNQAKLLPNIDKRNLNLNLVASPSKNPKSKVVLLTSLYLNFYENMTDLYLNFPTETGEVVSVFQPSHEERQVFGNSMHNVRAFAEMYLLSLSGALVTTEGSTFGYVAQSLGGLRPWVLHFPEKWNRTKPACNQAESIEPCLHIAPDYDCKKRAWADMGNVVPYVRHCNGVRSWLKLTNNYTSSRWS